MGSRPRGGDGGLPKFALAQAASRMDGGARRVGSPNASPCGRALP